MERPDSKQTDSRKDEMHSSLPMPLELTFMDILASSKSQQLSIVYSFNGPDIWEKIGVIKSIRSLAMPSLKICYRVNLH